MSIKVNIKTVRVVVCIFVALFISAVLVYIENLIGDESYLGSLIVFILFFVNVIWIFNWKVSNNVRIVIYLGYALYYILAFVQTYASGIMPTFLASSDQDNFLQTARLYLQGYYDDYRTNFPYLLRFFFALVGNSELAIRMINIECVLFGAFLLTKIGGYLSGKTDQILIAFYMLNPWNIFAYTQILREPYKHIFLMISIYFLLTWMKTGKMKYIICSILSSVPVLWLHNGEIGIVAVIFMAYVFWEPRKKEWKIYKLTWKSALIVLSVLFFPQIYGVFTYLFPGKFTGAFSLDFLIDKATVITDGRSTYIPEITISSSISFAYWSLYRMFYFWASPTPRFWSSINDVIMFVIDTVPWIVFFAYMIRKMKRSCCDGRCKLIIPFFVFMTFIFAWGTINAGTAIRHRDHFIGVMVMLALLKDENIDAEMRNGFDAWKFSLMD